tara:strand:+ start:755 stop:862 length:108 start_codon:yes stop_codon:yes gene_type:complete
MVSKKPPLDCFEITTGFVKIEWWQKMLQGILEIHD